tara:strand:+ start:1322 stop:1870 length:549 start_codon:yes stop_codon:yes gene_type:complete
MAFNVDTFKSNFSDGGARPNLFSVSIQTPGLVPALDQGGSFEVKAAQIPASTIAQVDVPYFGRQIRVPGNRTFEPWTVTAFNKENFGIRNAMEQWMDKINSHVSNDSLISQSYKADATVRHYGKNGGSTPIATYTFYGLFPTEIAAIELGWDTNDSIEEFTMTFAYDYWEHSGVISSAAPGR